MSDTPKLGMPFEAQVHPGRAQEWIIQRLIRGIRTATLVKVTAVHPTAGTVGFVDVMDLVQQQTTNGVVIDGAQMFRLPYLRMQGGQSAIILDPAVGDIGLAAFGQRDLSAAISTREPAPAPTNRAYDAGDGLYLGGFLNADPTQFIEFLPTGGINIEATGPVNVNASGAATLTAPSWTVSGPVTFNDPITAPEATINGVPVSTHKHISAPSGSPTGGPIS